MPLSLFRTARETLRLSLSPEEVLRRLKPPAVDLGDRPPLTWGYRQKKHPTFWGHLRADGFRFLHRPLPGVQSAIVDGKIEATDGQSEIRLASRVNPRNQAGILLGILTLLLLVHLKARVFIVVVIPLLLFSSWRLKRDRDRALQTLKEYLRGD